jgi:hypothetical protein
MNKKLILILIFAIPVVPALLFYIPPENPLAGVKTVGIIEPAEHKLAKVSQVLEGLNAALAKQNIEIVHDLAKADALIYGVELKFAEFEFKSASGGFAGNAYALLTVSRNNQESLLDLYVILDENGMKAYLVGRRFWEFWK